MYICDPRNDQPRGVCCLCVVNRSRYPPVNIQTDNCGNAESEGQEGKTAHSDCFDKLVTPRLDDVAIHFPDAVYEVALCDEDGESCEEVIDHVDCWCALDADWISVIYYHEGPFTQRMRYCSTGVERLAIEMQ